jgi:hypothetical protein
VVNSVTGEPIRRALVEVADHSMLTDDDGRFELHKLAEMQTTVNVHKPGFFSEQDIEQDQATPQQIVQIGPETPPVVAKLIPEGIIFGKIDSDGGPVEGILVKAIAPRIIDGRKRWEQRATTTTDEDGMFRLANLPPGTYYVSTGPKWNPSAAALKAGKLQGYPLVFYPNAAEMDGAALLQVPAGQQVQADFNTKPVSAVDVTGVVRGFSPAAGLSFQFAINYGELMAFPSGYDGTGRFWMKVPLGEYRLLVRSRTAEGVNVGADVPLDVTGDLNALQIQLAPNFEILVNVQKTAVASPRANTPQFHIGGPNSRRQDVIIRLMPEGPPGRAEPFANLEGAGKDARLVIRNAEPGKYSVVALPIGNWYVASLQCGDIDLLRDRLVVTAGVRLPPIEVQLRDDAATVTATITTDGQAAKGWVLLIPSRAPAHAIAQYVAADQATISNLAPGEYSALAVDRINGLEYSNLDALSEYMGKATHIILAPEQELNVNLEVIHVPR